MDDLRHVDTWVFDMDNTLYDARPHVFPRMFDLMITFISRELGVSRDEASGIQKRLFEAHGTTLNGMMREHGVDPAGFLRVTHDIDVAPVPVCALTRDALSALPGRKLVFTNSAHAFARRMIDHLGLAPHIEDIFAIEHGGFTPKPEKAAFEAFLARHGVDPARACMFEDSEQNLRTARALGMKTVWLHNDEDAHAPHPHVDHRHTRLTDWFQVIQKKNEIKNHD